ncbi:MAG TPA: hypothetical protein ENG74_00945 [Thermoplasmatales archaeon]|nr:hypothetical protein [Thermoplasmatales archaeon]
MGFSTVAAVAILGVCLVVCIDIFTGSVAPSVSDLGISYREMGERIAEKIQTDIDIVGYSTTPSTGTPFNLTIVVKNNGSTTIETDECNILINGTIYSFSSTPEYLYPKKTASFTISGLTERGLKRIKVVTGNGISDYEEYTL